MSEVGIIVEYVC